MKALLLLFLFWFECIVGQVPCQTSGIIFTRQSQLDSFNILFPNCTRATKIEIFGQNIENLKALSNLTKANVVSIGNTRVTNLSGLHNLVESSIILKNNQLLNNLNELRNIKKSDNFSISDCNILQNFKGINIDTISELILSGNILAQNLDGLSCKYTKTFNIYDWKFQHLGGGSIKGVQHMELSRVSNIDSVSRFNDLETLEINFSDLTDFNEIKNIFTLKHLIVVGNKELFNCASELICNKINNPNFKLDVGLNKKGCNTIDEIRAACTSSQEDEEQQIQIHISPNPTYDILTIDSAPLVTEIMVYDVRGQLVMKYALDDEKSKSLDVSHLNAGMYFIRLMNSFVHDHAMHKIVKL